MTQAAAHGLNTATLAIFVSLASAVLAVVGGVWAARIASRATTSSALAAAETQREANQLTAEAQREANRIAAEAQRVQVEARQADRRWAEMQHLYELTKQAAADAQAEAVRAWADRDEFRSRLTECEHARDAMGRRITDLEHENRELREQLGLPPRAVSLAHPGRANGDTSGA